PRPRARAPASRQARASARLRLIGRAASSARSPAPRQLHAPLAQHPERLRRTRGAAMRRAGLFGPLMEITRLQAELNRLFSGILENQRAALATAAAWNPNADVLEDAQEVRIIVEVPGLAPEELSVAAQGNRVRIRGTKRAEPQ